MKPQISKSNRPSLVREVRGGEAYDYHPLGKYIVMALKVCGGRPTFKYTRLEVAFVLDLLATGWTIEKVVHEYEASRLSAEAIKEAIKLARKAFVQTTPKLRLAV